MRPAIFAWKKRVAVHILFAVCEGCTYVFMCTHSDVHRKDSGVIKFTLFSVQRTIFRRRCKAIWMFSNLQNLHSRNLPVLDGPTMWCVAIIKVYLNPLSGAVWDTLFPFTNLDVVQWRGHLSVYSFRWLQSLCLICVSLVIMTSCSVSIISYMCVCQTWSQWEPY